MSQAKDEIGFHFKEIPLDEALSAVAAGRGRYAQLVESLLHKLPSLSPDKAFAFGLPNGTKLSDADIKKINTTVNSKLRRAECPWKVVYSETRHLFVCCPLNVVAKRSYQKKAPPNNPTQPTTNSMLNDLVLKASTLFNIAPEHIVKAQTHRVKAVRTAVIMLAVKRFNLPRNEITDYFGISKATIPFHLKANKHLDKVAQLAKAL